uniref:Uncharacterized protein n=1 Tax=Zea mays TaxID=4577 RepID=C0PM71_MAIZE|nr:unknown [Zea mays]|eukprot:XP_020402059.1 uncharacterized protein LOC109943441 [Zea mays]
MIQVIHKSLHKTTCKLLVSYYFKTEAFIVQHILTHGTSLAALSNQFIRFASK